MMTNASTPSMVVRQVRDTAVTTPTQKVVIVNGNPEVLELLESVLEAGHYDVVFVESDAATPHERCRDRPARGGHAHLVREPVLVPGLGPLRDCRGEARERHLLRIAEHEVRTGMSH